MVTSCGWLSAWPAAVTRTKRAVAAQWRAWRPTLLQARAAAVAAAQGLGAQARRLVQEIRARWAAPQR